MTDDASARRNLTAAVRNELTTNNQSPDDRSLVLKIARGHVENYQRRITLGHGERLDNPERLILGIADDVGGNDPLTGLLHRPGVQDVWVTGGDPIPGTDDKTVTIRYISTSGRLDGLATHQTEADCIAVLQQLLTGTDTPLDRHHPVLNGVIVMDGRARIAGVIPPAGPNLAMAIRLYTAHHADGDQLVEWGTLTPAALDFLRLAVWAGCSILISGATSSGKTTVLAALLREVRPHHAVALIEEFPELAFRNPHGWRMNTVTSDSSGQGAVALVDLLRASMRMNPQVVVVGEVRGEESWDMAQAATIGAGCLFTIHSRSASSALERLVLTAPAHIGESQVRRTFGQAIDLVVHCERVDPATLKPGDRFLRQVTEIRALQPMLGDLAFSSEPVFARKRLGTPLVPTGKSLPDELTARMQSALPKGQTVDDVLAGRGPR